MSDILRVGRVHVSSSVPSTVLSSSKSLPQTCHNCVTFKMPGYPLKMLHELEDGCTSVAGEAEMVDVVLVRSMDYPKIIHMELFSPHLVRRTDALVWNLSVNHSRQ